jgi:hypothetical protein
MDTHSKWYGQWFSRRRAIVVGEAGVTEVMWLGPNVVHAWESIEGVVQQADLATVVKRDGPDLYLGPTIPQWQALTEHINAELRSQDEQAGTAAELDAEQLAGWLGIEPGSVLVVGHPAVANPVLRRRMFALAALAPAVGALAGELAVRIGIQNALLTGLMVGLLTAVFLVLRTVLSPVWQASTDGLRLTIGWRRWRFAWDDLTGVSAVKSDTGWGVTTRRKRSSVPAEAPGAEPLVRAMRMVLAARARGRELPTTGPLPDGALSQVRLTGEEGAERGVSRVEGVG